MHRNCSKCYLWKRRKLIRPHSGAVRMLFLGMLEHLHIQLMSCLSVAQREAMVCSSVCLLFHGCLAGCFAAFLHAIAVQLGQLFIRVHAHTTQMSSATSLGLQLLKSIDHQIYKSVINKFCILRKILSFGVHLYNP